MATLKFSSEVEGSGRRLDMADTTKAVLQMSIGGKPVHDNANGAAPGSEPAMRFNSSAPYVPPSVDAPERPPERAKRCLGGGDTCMGWATATGYCRPHTINAKGD